MALLIAQNVGSLPSIYGHHDNWRYLLISGLIPAIPLIVIVQAFRSEAQDRWPEGVLVGVYLGTLGSISLIALIDYFFG